MNLVMTYKILNQDVKISQNSMKSYFRIHLEGIEKAIKF